MATRLYLSATETSAVSPGYAAWTATTEADRYMMRVVKDASTLANKTIWAGGTAAVNDTRLARQYHSAPMVAGTVISASDTIKCVIRCYESNADDNVNRTPLCLKVYNGTTLQATLKALGAYGPNTTEWNTALRNKQLADGDTLDAGYTTATGDYLVLEVGGQVSSAGGATVTAYMNFGSSSATDCAENETATTANNPWFEMSTTITFTVVDLVYSLAAGANDGYIDTSTLSTTDTWADIGSPWSDSSSAYLRFTGVTIPSGATVDLAHVYVSVSAWVTAAMRIYAQQSSDVTTNPSSRADFLPAARTRTANYTALTTWATGWQNTPDIAAVIGELVTDYSGLSSAGVMIFIDDNGSAGSTGGSFNTYENSAIAQLYIRYTAGSTAENFTQTISPLLGLLNISLGTRKLPVLVSKKNPTRMWPLLGEKNIAPGTRNVPKLVGRNNPTRTRPLLGLKNIAPGSRNLPKLVSKKNPTRMWTLLGLKPKTPLDYTWVDFSTLHTPVPYIIVFGNLPP
jgi:hypothetical protein